MVRIAPTLSLLKLCVSLLALNLEFLDQQGFFFFSSSYLCTVKFKASSMRFTSFMTLDSRRQTVC